MSKVLRALDFLEHRGSSKAIARELYEMGFIMYPEDVRGRGCPIALYMNHFVPVRGGWLAGPGRVIGGNPLVMEDYGPLVRKFISDFDGGRYPELTLGGKKRRLWRWRR